MSKVNEFSHFNNFCLTFFTQYLWTSERNPSCNTFEFAPKGCIQIDKKHFFCYLKKCHWRPTTIRCGLKLYWFSDVSEQIYLTRFYYFGFLNFYWNTMYISLCILVNNWFQELRASPNLLYNVAEIARHDNSRPVASPKYNLHLDWRQNTASTAFTDMVPTTTSYTHRATGNVLPYS